MSGQHREAFRSARWSGVSLLSLRSSRLHRYPLLELRFHQQREVPQVWEVWDEESGLIGMATAQAK
ncbi:MAG: hypothetical protein K1X67_12325 [Fimbriimonadaceae bacterium]|nr:hypothetical protein [Fimbriimonadaceae bacterium]